MIQSTGPDFICIGLAKGGTGWLYDQLRAHPDFWMPPIKEIRYLDRKIPRIGRAKVLLARARKAVAQTGETRQKAGQQKRFDERDLGFLEALYLHREEEMSLERYGVMFRAKGDLLSGDVTPTYCMMRNRKIARIFMKFPVLKVVLLVRDPVDRAWSHLAMLHRKEIVETAMLRDVDRFRTLLDTNKTIKSIMRRGLPAEIAARWREKVPQGQFRHFFFDDIAAGSDAARGEIVKFLGGDPQKHGQIAAEHNRKSTLPKLEMAENIKAVLVERLADELRASRDVLGGHAIEWARKYGI
jgi:hypothetical protein